MHYLRMAAAVVALAALSACGTSAIHQTQTSSPTVSYSYTNNDDFDVIQARAELYCEEEFNRDAVLIDRDVDGNSYEATFACD